MALDRSQPCPNCGQTFRSLALHWNRSSTCGYPEPTDEQKLVLEMMAVAGHTELRDAYDNPTAIKSTSNKEFADWMVEKLGFMSRARNKSHTEEAYGRTGYVVKSRCHPWIHKLHEKYGGGDDE